MTERTGQGACLFAQGLGSGVCLERGTYSYRLEHGWWTPAMLAIPLIGWSGAACGSQDCLAVMQAITAEAEQRVLLPDLLTLGARQSGTAVLGRYNDKPQSEARDMHSAAAPVELSSGADSATTWYCSGTG